MFNKQFNVNYLLHIIVSKYSIYTVSYAVHPYSHKSTAYSCKIYSGDELIDQSECDEMQTSK